METIVKLGLIGFVLWMVAESVQKYGPIAIVGIAALVWLMKLIEKEQNIG